MAKALVVYDSKTGNTEKIARAIGEGLKNAGLDTQIKRVDDTSLNDLTAADAIILGSPAQFCTMSDKMKAFIDRTIAIYSGLQDKVGAAFTSSGEIGEGGETTLLSLIQAMLMHKMIIVGHQSGSFGAVSIGAPDRKQIARCKEFGKRIASFVKQ